MESVSDLEAIIESFIDDAGNTGENLEDPVQRNLFLACLVVPCLRASGFWTRIEPAWQIAASVTNHSSHEIELKGNEIYGGQGPFEGVPLNDSCRILDTIVEASIAERLCVFSQGMPKHEWSSCLREEGLKPENLPFSKLMLYTFLRETYGLLDQLYDGPHEFRMTADENSWIHKNHVLQSSDQGSWSRLADKGIVFRSSAELRGLQVVDIIVHTLYRANKDACPPPNTPPARLSETDKLAHAYMKRLEDGSVLHNLVQARKQVSGLRGRT